MNELDIEELDFEIVSEPWNKYKLEDGSIVRVKNPAIKAFKTSQLDGLGTHVYRMGGLTLISSTVPKELKGEPSSDENITSSDIISECKFTTLCEDWCEYKLSNGVILRSKTVVTKIMKTKKFNKYGEPIYWCAWQILADKTMPK